jgi:sugar (pentulose or hexulose) kinase
MAETLLVGLDVGTTAVKAAVVTAEGVERAHGRSKTPWRVTTTGAELDADRLLDSVWEAASEALRRVPDGKVAGVGVQHGRVGGTDRWCRASRHSGDRVA